MPVNGVQNQQGMQAEPKRSRHRKGKRKALRKRKLMRHTSKQ